MAKLPVADFLMKRLKEYDPTFEVRKGTGFAQLFINPLQFMLQPIIDEAVELTLAQSFYRILQQPDPDGFPEERVDSLASNFFVERDPGGKSAGVARIYYATPVNREWPANGAIITGSNGKTYTNPNVFSITRDTVAVQIDNGLFYYDLPVQSLDLGDDTALDANGLVGIDNDPDALTVSNLAPITGGKAKETNTQLITRTRRSIAVRDLVTGKGFNATMFENFVSFLTEITPIGYGEPEMMRDIMYNIHVGGKIDGYFKTANITAGYKNFVGLFPDSTRQAYGSTNLQLVELDASVVPDGNFDTSNDKFPIVMQVKSSTIAKFTTTVDLSTPIALPEDTRVKITINNTTWIVNIAGVTPGATTRSEIINHINAKFGYIVAFSMGADIPFIDIRSPTFGGNSFVGLEPLDPSTEPGTDGLFLVFADPDDYPSGVLTYGTGPIVFQKDTHYTIDPNYGSIQRVFGPLKLTSFTGTANGTTTFTDASADFTDIQINDILTVNPDTELEPEDPSNDYRILGVPDAHTLILDGSMVAATDIYYKIRRTGIKNKETVYIQYWFNPLSIDIGRLVWYEDTSVVPPVMKRGIRPGRETFTITDVAFLRINKIEIIDPITYEPTGDVLATGGGYGEGGYGEGPYGIGSGTDYYMIVNSPHERFSAFEDSFIVLNPNLIGLSVRVDYDYVPECLTMHNFVRSESERVLDGDILMKHFLPAYVEGTIQYRVDATDSTIPDNDTLTTKLKAFINTQPSGSNLEISEVYQFLARTTDPYDRYGTYIKPFTLKAMIHNTDGTTTIVSSGDKLVVPTPSPFPKDTDKPLSPRITHWVAGDIVLERVTA